jgi:hypothetical protein
MTMQDATTLALDAALSPDEMPIWLTTADIFDVSGQFLLLKEGTPVSDSTIDKLRGFGVAPRIKPIYPQVHPESHTAPMRVSERDWQKSDPESHLPWPHVVVMGSDLTSLRRCSFWLQRAGMPMPRIHPASNLDAFFVLIEKYAPKAVLLPVAALAMALPRLQAMGTAMDIVAVAPAAEAKSVLKRRQWQAAMPQIGVSTLWFEPLDKRVILPWAEATLKPQRDA